jgi:hypothetical protein
MTANRPKHRKTPEQIEATRKGLVAIRDWCREGWIAGPLPQLERLALWTIMDDLIEGYDPRAGLGIPPKRGAPSGLNRGFHSWLAGHYWHLRKAGDKDTVALKTVALAWGVSAAQVRKLSRANREAWKDRLASGQFRTDNFEGMAEVFRQQNQIRK